jgi:4-hydroxy-tetrahydrodipicolinate reductase
LKTTTERNLISLNIKHHNLREGNLMNALQIAINGAGGRMGKRLISLGHADPQLKIAAAIEASNHPGLGDDAGEQAGIGTIGIPLSDQLGKKVDAMIDFSNPQSTDDLVKQCVEWEVPLVFATTGLSKPQLKKLEKAAETIPLLHAPNTSMAVNLTMKLTEIAARAMQDQDADVEILERHHRFKADSPSGTALKFGEIIAREMGQKEHRHGREGNVGARPHEEIGYHAIRVGDNPGEHTLVFGMLGETIELTVRASSRDCYALGALAAAKFLVDKKPGQYTMNDVLGL